MMSNNKDTLGTSKNTQSAQQWHFRFLMPEKKSFYGCMRFLLTLVVVLFAHVCPRNTTWLVRIPFCPTCQVRVSRLQQRCNSYSATPFSHLRSDLDLTASASSSGVVSPRQAPRQSRHARTRAPLRASGQAGHAEHMLKKMAEYMPDGMPEKKTRIIEYNMCQVECQTK